MTAPERLTPIFTQPSTYDIAARLRLIRKSRHWSLGDIEQRTHGRIKAVVLGSYERSDRALSVKRAIELAAMYEVPLSYLLCAPGSSPSTSQPIFRLIVDLRAISASTDSSDAMLTTVQTFLGWIAGQRNDWNGEILSLRKADLDNLALLTFSTQESMTKWLADGKYLLTATNRL
ncbi:unannotated protein [freshwater metagenome]|jgi:transcriptional regulator with XRE-family HTH domain|uniref:Unannotated protein n=1 Tax=freshwater metagenome TaxID=449393 RepID=A0A6J7TIZ7_9ZZZZ|nr:helix-turn-helix domain-containing protein [Actinomycetota bacterium]MSW57862.1 helix-turn-helix domain-containing protein [Actinomycetota bacterium]MSX48853.1 helix-turn-helix domain-containing protein [Actinomycetota bacterium]MSY09233.1 helix-turn-helix domain-containing protein [Actinomycetota bacterium]MSY54069.1 helix-turn-helix domain-containing protein [Actinomycetota bacterium]